MMPVLKLIERHLAMSEIRSRLSEETPRQPGRYVTPGGVGFGPCVLISRECGSGSTLLAEKLGEELGWNVFDSKIVDEIAKAAHVHQRLVQSVDESVHSHWEQAWRELLLDDLSDKRYLHHLGQILTALGHQGNVVIVGRGAQYLLPAQCALRVRLVAPIEARIKRIAELENLSPEEARVKIKQVDATRASFIGKIFKKEVGSPLNNDMVINTGQIGIESAAKIVLVALHEKLGVSFEKHLDFLTPTHKPLAA